jgi:hypothetical protein
MHVRMTQSFCGHAKGQTFSSVLDSVAKAWISRGVAEEYMPPALGGTSGEPPVLPPKQKPKAKRKRKPR